MIDNFLGLLRCGIWGGEPHIALLTPEGWERLYATARHQAVTGVMAEAVAALPDELLPPDALLARWAAAAATVEERNARMSRVLPQLLGELAQHGAVLMKGHALAALYPRPGLRECGDIDLWLPDPKHSVKSLTASASLRRQADGSLCFTREGVLVELHRELFDSSNPLAHRSLVAFQRRFGMVRQWIPGAECEAWVPAPTLGVLMQTLHILKHALTRGIGIRQFCDLTLYSHRHRADIDMDALADISRTLGLTQWHQLLSDFIRAYMQPSSPNPPSSSDPFRLLQLVMERGNFGAARYAATDSQPPLRHKFDTATSFFADGCFPFSVAPKEALWTLWHLCSRQFTAK